MNSNPDYPYPPIHPESPLPEITIRQGCDLLVNFLLDDLAKLPVRFESAIPAMIVNLACGRLNASHAAELHCSQWQRNYTEFHCQICLRCKTIHSMYTRVTTLQVLIPVCPSCVQDLPVDPFPYVPLETIIKSVQRLPKYLQENIFWELLDKLQRPR